MNCNALPFGSMLCYSLPLCENTHIRSVSLQGIELVWHTYCIRVKVYICPCPGQNLKEYFQPLQSWQKMPTLKKYPCLILKQHFSRSERKPNTNAKDIRLWMFSNSAAFVTGLQQESLATSHCEVGAGWKETTLDKSWSGEREGGRECQKVIFSQLPHNAF